MSMYLSNPDLQPTGHEAVEFLDVQSMADSARASDELDVERRAMSTTRLDLDTRLNLTRRVKEYIVGLVESRSGDPEDVRSIISDLHDQGGFTFHDGTVI
jgi:hypothetical protein